MPTLPSFVLLLCLYTSDEPCYPDSVMCGYVQAQCQRCQIPALSSSLQDDSSSGNAGAFAASCLLLVKSGGNPAKHLQESGQDV